MMRTSHPSPTVVHHGDDNALLALAKDMDMPDRVLDLVKQSGCESRADWKFAVLTRPGEDHEACLRDAVQGAGALDIGGVAVLAAQARAKPRRATMPPM